MKCDYMERRDGCKHGCIPDWIKCHNFFDNQGCEYSAEPRCYRGWHFNTVEEYNESKRTRGRAAMTHRGNSPHLYLDYHRVLETEPLELPEIAKSLRRLDEHPFRNGGQSREMRVTPISYGGLERCVRVPPPSTDEPRETGAR